MSIEPSKRNAAHLLRRLGWGGTPNEIAAVADTGIAASVDVLLDPAHAPVVGEPGRSRGEYPYFGESLSHWFFHLAATSPAPAVEKLLWFWHGHFATSLAKVDHADLLHRQWITLRRYGLGRFDDLLLAVTHDPAMQIWLDLHESVVGQPNENYARELLELFSMGAGNGYQQADVREAARALTGFAPTLHPELDRPLGTRLVPALHDYGEKTFLGVRGALTAPDIIAAIVERPECHRFVAGRVWHRYAGTEMPDEVGEVLAAAFAQRHRIDDLVRTMVTLPRFYDEDVRGGLIAQPVEVLVRAIRGFDLPIVDNTDRLADDLIAEAEADDQWYPFMFSAWAERMDQYPGAPPNVGGWPHNEPWLDSNRAAARLLVGLEMGEFLAWGDTETGELLRELAPDVDALVEEILLRFGVVEWSTETEAAIAAAARTPNAGEAVAAAFAMAFTSPEVTLA